MIKYNLHTHTSFCDGGNTAEEMARAAIGAGLEYLGFSGHSFTFFDTSYCMSREDTIAYRREIARLKAEFGGRLNILCGVEQDYYSEESTDGYDFVIGSVHYLKTDDGYYPVDNSVESFEELVNRHFGGDHYAAAELYYETVADSVRKTGADVIGHFDVIATFNRNNLLFDESDPRYVSAWRAAADRLIGERKVFEINTGGIARGLKSEPYPSLKIIKYIRDNGGKFILSSDCHDAGKLCVGFDEYEKYTDGGFVEQFLKGLLKRV